MRDDDSLAPRGTGSGSGTVLVVDDFESNRRLLETLLAKQQYRVIVASGGHEALRLVAEHSPDVVLTDLRMPDGDGMELCRALKSAEKTRLIPIVIMTGSLETGDRMSAIESGADDFLTKPVDYTELSARIKSLMRVKRFTDDLESATTVLRSLAMTVEARDAYTLGHCERLAHFAMALGRQIGLDDEDVRTLRLGGYFHDLGKIALPDAILLKPGPLTREEFDKVKEHPIVGEQLCGDLRSLRLVRPIVRLHHERLDGGGYPDGLKGDAIPLLAQVIGVVDVFDAMTTNRPYRAALDAATAQEQLRDEAKRGWRSRDLVEQFIATQS
jgi:putative two-component system response regulator